MRVLFINDHLHTLGGAEIYLNQIKEALQNRSIKTSLLAFNEQKKDISDVHSLSHRITHLRRSIIAQKNVIQIVQQKIKAFQPDVIHVNKNKIYTNSVNAVLRKLNIPVFQTIHDGTDAIFYNNLKANLQKKILRPTPDNLHFVLPSKHFYDRLEQLNIQAISHIPHFIEVEKWPLRNPADVLPKQLLFVGRIDHTKGIYTLLEALKIVVTKDPEVQLVCIGKGKEMEEFKQRINDLKLENNTQLLGFQNQTTILKYFHQSTIFLYPSNYEELFGITGLEAQAAGIPVIASDIGGIKEWCVDQKSGLLVPPGEAQPLAEKIMQLMQDTSLQQKLSQQAHQQVHSFFSLEYSISKLVDLYKKSIQEKTNR